MKRVKKGHKVPVVVYKNGKICKRMNVVADCEQWYDSPLAESFFTTTVNGKTVYVSKSRYGKQWVVSAGQIQ